MRLHVRVVIRGALRGALCGRDQILLQLSKARRIDLRNPPRERVLHDARHHAVQQVAEPIAKLAVVAREQVLVAEVAVGAERDIAHQVIAKRVFADGLHERDRRQEVARRLAHLLAIHGHPAVREHGRWKRQSRAHQEDGPVDRVKAHDLFADEVHRLTVRRPVLREEVALRTTKRTHVVRERIEPDVHHVLRRTRNGDAPAEGRA